MGLRGTRNMFVPFLQVTFYFPWHAQHFGGVHGHFSWKMQDFGRVLLRVLANCIAGAVSRSENVQIVWQTRDILTASFCVAGAAFGADPSRVACHFDWQGQYLAQF
eukprot:s1141_g39.t1